MPKRPSNDMRDCRERAAVCRRRADATDDPQGRAFWQAQERRWLGVDAGCGIAKCVSTCVHLNAGSLAAPQPEDGIAALIDVFHRVCAELKLDGAHQALPRRVAHTILEAALDGEDNLDSLYARALKAASH